MSRLPHRHAQLLVIRLLLCAGLLAIPPCTLATAPSTAIDTPAALAEQINALVTQPRFAGASWGIAVVSLDSGDSVYTHQADRLLQPASTAKLFTAGLALAVLGPDYRMPTRLLAGKPVVHGHLNGPLILYGRGDPTLGSSSSADWAEQLARQAAARGLKFVQGDLLADDSYFASPAFGNGWEATDLQSWFAVPTSALSVQENIVSLTISPSAVGQPAQLAFAPVEAAPSIDNQLLTTTANTQSDINLYRAPGTATLHAFGTVAAGSPVQTFRLAMVDPALVAGAELRQALKRHGIRVTGKLRAIHWPQRATVRPATAELLGEVQSPPLREIVQRGLKRSQNLYLQNLLLSVGATQPASTTGFRSSENRALDALHQWLQQSGIPPLGSLLEEGAGLSRRDLITPNAMARLLSYLATQPYAQTLRAALPVAGVDGTLIRRMRGTAAENNVHAKTGSMSQVHCLAGYVTSAAGERLAFAIMLNNYERPPDAPTASNEVDAIAILLANYRGHD
ncbi:D-alanyl-D-alanine carboxypeptidase/D-alanyl-D-alanine-endopeptidase [Rhodanobacter sp. AS-Z3]|uniref:D-alanyl-D-alanine carboxypeptidase/D-alanyl-D-alanine endopeptidase n=1 Tax=Rhodanobacter sp. AS-Z3 TaxID=3031330 RepID=UPI00247892BF|nr:D-alanyl-D-alanine carboxypeptidase/D-alanyl-D-alanine-endopeptidase [Rhodanobacter sp. AS-Z3]WEN14391.1 D-alanyl-D-alanine carboxypeptidase/D-alanyl-D-alanine-endopeptidase [Rhodanobacter sp. AS-Z3]